MHHTMHHAMKSTLAYAVVILLVAASVNDAAPVPEDAVVPESDLAEVGDEWPPLYTLQPCTEGPAGNILRSKGSTGKPFRCQELAENGSPITYGITVPSHCTSAEKCGVIVNIHGQFMNSHMMEASTGISAQALGGSKFIVLMPEDANATWDMASFGQFDDAAKIYEMLQKVMEAYKDIVDTNHIHASGFSAGSTLTFEMLCSHSETICSTATIGFNPIAEFVNFLEPGSRYNHGSHTCWSGASAQGPAVKRSIMYHQGKNDPFFMGLAENSFQNTVTKVKTLYGIQGQGQRLNKGAGVEWTRYTSGSGAGPVTPEVTLEVAEYEFINPGFVKGHCIPFKDEQSSANMAYPASFKCGNDPAGNVAAYSFGEAAVKFFESHGCGRLPTTVTDKTDITLTAAGGLKLDWSGAGRITSSATSSTQVTWILKKCISGDCSTGALGSASRWTSASSAPSDISTCDVVAWYNKGSGRVYDCAGPSCTSQPFPPPHGHWGTPFKIRREGAPCGELIREGDSGIYFSRMLHYGFVNTAYISCTGSNCGGTTDGQKTEFTIESTASAKAGGN